MPWSHAYDYETNVQESKGDNSLSWKIGHSKDGDSIPSESTSDMLGEFYLPFDPDSLSAASDSIAAKAGVLEMSGKGPSVERGESFEISESTKIRSQVLKEAGDMSHFRVSFDGFTSEQHSNDNNEEWGNDLSGLRANVVSGSDDTVQTKNEWNDTTQNRDTALWDVRWHNGEVEDSSVLTSENSTRPVTLEHTELLSTTSEDLTLPDDFAVEGQPLETYFEKTPNPFGSDIQGTANPEYEWKDEEDKTENSDKVLLSNDFSVTKEHEADEGMLPFFETSSKALSSFSSLERTDSLDTSPSRSLSSKPYFHAGAGGFETSFHDPFLDDENPGANSKPRNIYEDNILEFKGDDSLDMFLKETVPCIAEKTSKLSKEEMGYNSVENETTMDEEREHRFHSDQASADEYSDTQSTRFQEEIKTIEDGIVDNMSSSVPYTRLEDFEDDSVSRNFQELETVVPTQEGINPLGYSFEFLDLSLQKPVVDKSNDFLHEQRKETEEHSEDEEIQSMEHSEADDEAGEEETTDFLPRHERVPSSYSVERMESFETTTPGLIRSSKIPGGGFHTSFHSLMTDDQEKGAGGSPVDLLVNLDSHASSSYKDVFRDELSKKENIKTNTNDSDGWPSATDLQDETVDVSYQPPIYNLTHSNEMINGDETSAAMEADTDLLLLTMSSSKTASPAMAVHTELKSDEDIFPFLESGSKTLSSFRSLERMETFDTSPPKTLKYQAKHYFHVGAGGFQTSFHNQFLEDDNLDENKQLGDIEAKIVDKDDLVPAQDFQVVAETAEPSHQSPSSSAPLYPQGTSDEELVLMPTEAFDNLSSANTKHHRNPFLLTDSSDSFFSLAQMESEQENSAPSSELFIQAKEQSKAEEIYQIFSSPEQVLASSGTAQTDLEAIWSTSGNEELCVLDDRSQQLGQEANTTENSSNKMIDDSLHPLQYSLGKEDKEYYFASIGHAYMELRKDISATPKPNTNPFLEDYDEKTVNYANSVGENTPEAFNTTKELEDRTFKHETYEGEETTNYLHSTEEVGTLSLQDSFSGKPSSLDLRRSLFKNKGHLRGAPTDDFLQRNSNEPQLSDLTQENEANSLTLNLSRTNPFREGADLHPLAEADTESTYQSYGFPLDESPVKDIYEGFDSIKDHPDFFPSEEAKSSHDFENNAGCSEDETTAFGACRKLSFEERLSLEKDEAQTENILVSHLLITHENVTGAQSDNITSSPINPCSDDDVDDGVDSKDVADYNSDHDTHNTSDEDAVEDGDVTVVKQDRSSSSCTDIPVEEDFNSSSDRREEWSAGSTSADQQRLSRDSQTVSEMTRRYSVDNSPSSSFEYTFQTSAALKEVEYNYRQWSQEIQQETLPESRHVDGTDFMSSEWLNPAAGDGHSSSDNTRKARASRAESSEATDDFDDDSVDENDATESEYLSEDPKTPEVETRGWGVNTKSLSDRITECEDAFIYSSIPKDQQKYDNTDDDYSAFENEREAGMTELMSSKPGLQANIDENPFFASDEFVQEDVPVMTGTLDVPFQPSDTISHFKQTHQDESFPHEFSPASEVHNNEPEFMETVMERFEAQEALNDQLFLSPQARFEPETSSLSIGASFAPVVQQDLSPFTPVDSEISVSMSSSTARHVSTDTEISGEDTGEKSSNREETQDTDSCEVESPQLSPVVAAEVKLDDTNTFSEAAYMQFTQKLESLTAERIFDETATNENGEASVAGLSTELPLVANVPPNSAADSVTDSEASGLARDDNDDDDGKEKGYDEDDVFVVSTGVHGDTSSEDRRVSSLSHSSRSTSTSGSHSGSRRSSSDTGHAEVWLPDRDEETSELLSSMREGSLENSRAVVEEGYDGFVPTEERARSRAHARARPELLSSTSWSTSEQEDDEQPQMHAPRQRRSLGVELEAVVNADLWRAYEADDDATCSERDLPLAAGRLVQTPPESEDIHEDALSQENHALSRHQADDISDATDNDLNLLSSSLVFHRSRSSTDDSPVVEDSVEESTRLVNFYSPAYKTETISEDIQRNIEGNLLVTTPAQDEPKSVHGLRREEDLPEEDNISSNSSESEDLTNKVEKEETIVSFESPDFEAFILHRTQEVTGFEEKGDAPSTAETWGITENSAQRTENFNRAFEESEFYEAKMAAEKERSILLEEKDRERPWSSVDDDMAFLESGYDEKRSPNTFLHISERKPSDSTSTSSHQTLSTTGTPSIDELRGSLGQLDIQDLSIFTESDSRVWSDEKSPTIERQVGLKLGDEERHLEHNFDIMDRAELLSVNETFAEPPPTSADDHGLVTSEARMMLEAGRREPNVGRYGHLKKTHEESFGGTFTSSEGASFSQSTDSFTLVAFEKLAAAEIESAAERGFASLNDSGCPSISSLDLSPPHHMSGDKPGSKSYSFADDVMYQREQTVDDVFVYDQQEKAGVDSLEPEHRDELAEQGGTLGENNNVTEEKLAEDRKPTWMEKAINKARDVYSSVEQKLRRRKKRSRAQDGGLDDTKDEADPASSSGSEEEDSADDNDETHPSDEDKWAWPSDGHDQTVQPLRAAAFDGDAGDDDKADLLQVHRVTARPQLQRVPSLSSESEVNLFSGDSRDEEYPDYKVACLNEASSDSSSKSPADFEDRSKEKEGNNIFDQVKSEAISTLDMRWMSDEQDDKDGRDREYTPKQPVPDPGLEPAISPPQFMEETVTSGTEGKEGQPQDVPQVIPAALSENEDHIENFGALLVTQSLHQAVKELEAAGKVFPKKRLSTEGYEDEEEETTEDELIGVHEVDADEGLVVEDEMVNVHETVTEYEPFVDEDSITKSNFEKKTFEKDEPIWINEDESLIEEDVTVENNTVIERKIDTDNESVSEEENVGAEELAAAEELDDRYKQETEEEQSSQDEADSENEPVVEETLIAMQRNLQHSSLRETQVKTNDFTETLDSEAWLEPKSFEITQDKQVPSSLQEEHIRRDSHSSVDSDYEKYFPLTDRETSHAAFSYTAVASAELSPSDARYEKGFIVEEDQNSNVQSPLGEDWQEVNKFCELQEQEIGKHSAELDWKHAQPYSARDQEAESARMVSTAQMTLSARADTVPQNDDSSTQAGSILPESLDISTHTEFVSTPRAGSSAKAGSALSESDDDSTPAGYLFPENDDSPTSAPFTLPLTPKIPETEVLSDSLTPDYVKYVEIRQDEETSSTSTNSSDDEIVLPVKSPRLLLQANIQNKDVTSFENDNRVFVSSEQSDLSLQREDEITEQRLSSGLQCGTTYLGQEMFQTLPQSQDNSTEDEILEESDSKLQASSASETENLMLDNRCESRLSLHKDDFYQNGASFESVEKVEDEDTNDTTARTKSFGGGEEIREELLSPDYAQETSESFRSLQLRISSPVWQVHTNEAQSQDFCTSTPRTETASLSPETFYYTSRETIQDRQVQENFDLSEYPDVDVKADERSSELQEGEIKHDISDEDVKTERSVQYDESGRHDESYIGAESLILYGQDKEVNSPAENEDEKQSESSLPREESTQNRDSENEEVVADRSFVNDERQAKNSVENEEGRIQMSEKPSATNYSSEPVEFSWQYDVLTGKRSSFETNADLLPAVSYETSLGAARVESSPDVDDDQIDDAEFQALPRQPHHYDSSPDDLLSSVDEEPEGNLSDDSIDEKEEQSQASRWRVSRYSEEDAAVGKISGDASDTSRETEIQSRDFYHDHDEENEMFMLAVSTDLETKPPVREDHTHKVEVEAHEASFNQWNVTSVGPQRVDDYDEECEEEVMQKQTAVSELSTQHDDEAYERGEDEAEEETKNSERKQLDLGEVTPTWFHVKDTFATSFDWEKQELIAGDTFVDPKDPDAENLKAIPEALHRQEFESSVSGISDDEDELAAGSKQLAESDREREDSGKEEESHEDEFAAAVSLSEEASAPTVEGQDQESKVPETWVEAEASDMASDAGGTQRTSQFATPETEEEMVKSFRDVTYLTRTDSAEDHNEELVSMPAPDDVTSRPAIDDDTYDEVTNIPTVEDQSSFDSISHKPNISEESESGQQVTEGSEGQPIPNVTEDLQSGDITHAPDIAEAGRADDVMSVENGDESELFASTKRIGDRLTSFTKMFKIAFSEERQSTDIPDVSDTLSKEPLEQTATSPTSESTEKTLECDEHRLEADRDVPSEALSLKLNQVPQEHNIQLSGHVRDNEGNFPALEEEMHVKEKSDIDEKPDFCENLENYDTVSIQTQERQDEFNSNAESCSQEERAEENRNSFDAVAFTGFMDSEDTHSKTYVLPALQKDDTESWTSLPHDISQTMPKDETFVSGIAVDYSEDNFSDTRDVAVRDEFSTGSVDDVMIYQTDMLEETYPSDRETRFSPTDDEMRVRERESFEVNLYIISDKQSDEGQDSLSREMVLGDLAEEKLLLKQEKEMFDERLCSEGQLQDSSNTARQDHIAVDNDELTGSSLEDGAAEMRQSEMSSPHQYIERGFDFAEDEDSSLKASEEHERRSMEEDSPWQQQSDSDSQILTEKLSLSLLQEHTEVSVKASDVEVEIEPPVWRTEASQSESSLAWKNDVEDTTRKSSPIYSDESERNSLDLDKEHDDIVDDYEGFTKRSEDIQRYKDEHEGTEEPSRPDKTEPVESSNFEKRHQEDVDSEVDDELDEESDQQLKDSEREEIASRYEWLLKGSPSFSLEQAGDERKEYNFVFPEDSTESVSYSSTQEVKETFYIQQRSASLEAERTEEKTDTDVEGLMVNDTDERSDDTSERTVDYSGSQELEMLSRNLPCSNEQTFLNERSEMVSSMVDDEQSTENLQRQESVNSDSGLSEQAVTFVSSERREFAPETDSEQLRVEREIYSQEVAHSFRTELEEIVSDVTASSPETSFIRTTPSFADDKQDSNEEEEDLEDRHITKSDLYLQNDDVPERTYLFQMPDKFDDKEDEYNETQSDRRSPDLQTEDMEMLMREASIPQMMEARSEWADSKKSYSMSLDSLECVEQEEDQTEGVVDDLFVDDVQYKGEDHPGDAIVDEEDLHSGREGPADDEMDDLTDDEDSFVRSRAVESESDITFYPCGQELRMVQKTSSEPASVSLAAELLSASSQGPLCFSPDVDNESGTRIFGQDQVESRESGLETDPSTRSDLHKSQEFWDSSSSVSMATSSVDSPAWSSELRENVLSFSEDSGLLRHKMTETKLVDDIFEGRYAQLKEEVLLKDYHQSTEKESIYEDEIVPVRVASREMSQMVEDQSLSPEEGWEPEVSYKPSRSSSCLSKSSSISHDSFEENEVYQRDKYSSNEIYHQERRKSIDEEEIIPVKHSSRETNYTAEDNELVSRTEGGECELKVSEDLSMSPINLPVSVEAWQKSFEVSSSSNNMTYVTKSSPVSQSPPSEQSVFHQESDIRQPASRSSEAYQRSSSSSLDGSLTLSVSRMSAQFQDHGDLSPSQTLVLPMVDAGASSESVVRFVADDQAVSFRPSAAAGSAQGTIWATTSSHDSPTLRKGRQVSDDETTWEKFDQDHKPLIGGEAVNEDPALLDQENLDPNSMPFELFKKKNKTKRAKDKEAEVAENEVTDIIAEPLTLAESKETSVLVEENVANQTSSSDEGLTEVGEMTMKEVKSEQLYNEIFESAEPKLDTENLIQETSLEDSPAVLPTDDITDPVTSTEEEGPQLSVEDAINAQPNKLEDVGVDGKGRERESLLRDHNPEGLVCCTIL
ncbi:uncharacterized protein LOC112571670 isoform X2 [Pomacea canaliculata]|uniref:uncharacterized protein LOC112571670 isoform X2 n=1 Tax=Pomacea canaliculata TaxID=400727 RepID=UPI000D726A9B|nr:uncharacterized protein LOC112571670 isoform X2 [Pomacea canaliculata]